MVTDLETARVSTSTEPASSSLSRTINALWEPDGKNERSTVIVRSVGPFIAAMNQ
jgi:hypothetical protein